MPPMMSGSTVRVATTLRPEASSICLTTLAASLSESSTAVVSSSVEDALLAREDPAELFVNCLDLGDTSLLREKVDEVEEDLVRPREKVVERRLLHLGLHLGVAEKAAELVGLGERGRERVELLAHARDRVLVPGGLEEGLGVHTLGDGHGSP